VDEHTRTAAEADVIVCDLDGTLIDSKLAVIEAYRAVGVEMPTHAWGRPWQQWLHDEVAHTRKNDVYADMLRKYGEPLPLYQVAARHQYPVITGASSAAVAAIVGQFGWLNVVLTNASLEDKALWLHDHAPTGIYVDDDPLTRDYVRRYTGWTCYSPQDALLSIWPLGQTLDSKVWSRRS
jgi:FMN phosphatase YigB (HAD superfamily)